jgi:hypothetical protein
MTTGFSGGCLCGAVRFTCTAAPQVVGHCHCVDCRKSSGTGHCTHLVVPAAAFAVTGAVTFYDRAADSGNMVSRGFCGTCGSPIYSTNAAMPDVVFPRASVLDDPDTVQPQMIVFASRAPSWDHMSPALPAFATMPDGGPQKIIAEQSSG